MKKNTHRVMGPADRGKRAVKFGTTAQELEYLHTPRNPVAKMSWNPYFVAGVSPASSASFAVFNFALRKEVDYHHKGHVKVLISHALERVQALRNTSGDTAWASRHPSLRRFAAHCTDFKADPCADLSRNTHIR